MAVKSAPVDDLETNYVMWNGQKFEIKKRFKVGKFLRLINSNPGEALVEVFTPEALEAYEDTEFTFPEFGQFMEEVASALTGADQKN
jgi:hypothetical protein